MTQLVTQLGGGEAEGGCGARKKMGRGGAWDRIRRREKDRWERDKFEGVGVKIIDLERKKLQKFV